MLKYSYLRYASILILTEKLATVKRQIEAAAKQQLLLSRDAILIEDELSWFRVFADETEAQIQSLKDKSRISINKLLMGLSVNPRAKYAPQEAAKLFKDLRVALKIQSRWLFKTFSEFHLGHEAEKKQGILNSIRRKRERLQAEQKDLDFWLGCTGADCKLRGLAAFHAENPTLELAKFRALIELESRMPLILFAEFLQCLEGNFVKGADAISKEGSKDRLLLLELREENARNQAQLENLEQKLGTAWASLVKTFSGLSRTDNLARYKKELKLEVGRRCEILKQFIEDEVEQPARKKLKL